MKTISVKIDDSLLSAAMKRGGFKKPEEAVTYALKVIIERPQKKDAPAAKSKHSPLVEKMTGVLKTDKDFKELMADARDSR